jgi:hypothetical protein
MQRKNNNFATFFRQQGKLIVFFFNLQTLCFRSKTGSDMVHTNKSDTDEIQERNVDRQLTRL